MEDRHVPSSFQTLYNFTGGSDGKLPKGGVIVDNSGNLYGTTTSGSGPTSSGTTFEFNSQGTFKTLIPFFSGAGGSNAGLIRDSSGNFHGVTTAGSTDNDGTVFKLNPDGTTLTVLHSFLGSDGATPEGPLVMDKQGDLFGTTFGGGGSSASGTVFELSPNASGNYDFKTLHSFSGSDGINLMSGLLLDSQGNLYGTTTQGGADGNGTVFKISSDGSFSVLHNFAGGSDGKAPVGGLIMDGDGNIYGTTYGVASGTGADTDGTVFKISSGGTFTTIYNFTGGSDGAFPEGKLLLDSIGNLFGTTFGALPNSSGSVFELSPDGSGGYTFTPLHSFTGVSSDGANPYAGLTVDRSGNLYGTTYAGGTDGDGTIFEITGAATIIPPVVTPSTATLPVNATTITINGTGLDTNPANDSVTFDNGVTGTVTSATATSLTVSLSGLSSLSVGTALDASVTVNDISSGNPVQVATIGPAVFTFPIIVNDNSDVLDNLPNVTAATLGPKVSLRDAINAANNTGGGNSFVINLQANTTYDLTAIDNYLYGPDGLPPIFSNITIQGNGAVIQRDTASGTPDFRLFYVSGGFDGLPPGNLTLENVTLEGGVAQGGSSGGGGGGLGAGGAIFNQGALTLTGVTLANNQAIGGSGGVKSDGPGGGGMGQDAQGSVGGGFGGLVGPLGGQGGLGGLGGGSGGGGFRPGDMGGSVFGTAAGPGGGEGGFGGSGGHVSNAGDGGGGGAGPRAASVPGGLGGFFGVGGNDPNLLMGYNGPLLGGGGGGIGGGGAGGGVFFTMKGAGGGGGFGGGGGGSLTYGGNGGFGGGGGFGGLDANRTGLSASGLGFGGFGGGAGATSGSTGSGGGGAGMGGGIFNMMGSVTITNSTLTGNTAQGGAGFGGGSGFGGAILNLDGTVSLTFDTLDANTVTAGKGTSSNGTASGGALYNLANGDNLSTGGAQSATATITDSILADSQGGSDLISDEEDGKQTNTAAVTLIGPNLVQTVNSLRGGTITGTPTVTADPQLEPLQNNGGLTPTMALLVTSPAYQAGTPISGITTDQSGVSRSTTAPTLGAVEALLPTVAANNAATPFNTGAQNVTLTADVSSSTYPLTGGTVTFTVMNGSTVVGTATTSGTVSKGLTSVSYALPAGTAPGSYTIDAVYNLGSTTFSTDTTHTLTVNPAATTVTVGNASTPFSESTQNATLTATVKSNAGTVNEGTVTFTILQGSTVIGTATTSGMVSNGAASVSYALPANLDAGSYSIDAVYNPGADFTTNSDTTHTLTLSPAATSILANNASVISSNNPNATLTANVTSTAGLVNTGTVTFTVKQGGTVIGTATTSTTVSNGAASVSYALPANPALGSYTIDAVYNPGADFATSLDNTHTLSVLGSTTTQSSNAAITFNNVIQNVTLTATVKSNSGIVNEGTVTFTILQGNTVIGTATTSGTVSNGAASVSYALPASQSGGSYTIDAVYNPGADFTTSSDTTHTFTVSPDNVATTAADTLAIYSSKQATIFFNASLVNNTYPNITVNEGTVTFTLLKGSTVVGTPTQATVSSGSASTSYSLPAGLAAGNYTIAVSYADSQGNFTDGGDTSATLSEIPGYVATTANNASAVYSPNAQNITVNATVSNTTFPGDTVGEGTVTFTLLDGSTVVGTPAQANLTAGNASTSYSLPPGLAPGVYTLQVSYADKNGNFLDQGDTNATLTIQSVPLLSTNPANQTVNAGGTAIFTTAANGNPTPTVKWQVSSNAGKNWTDISNATSTTLTLSNVSFSLNGNLYRAVFSNSLGHTATPAASLTVRTVPAITSGNSAVFTVGQSGSFLVTTSGSPAPMLTVSGALPIGVTFTDNGNGTASLAGIPPAGANGTYTVTLAASNGDSSGVTQSFTLTVNATPVIAPFSPSPSPSSSSSSAPSSSPQPPALNVPPLLAMLDAFLGGIETVNADGSATIIDNLFGLPPLVSTYDSAGNLVSVTVLGFDVTSLFV